MPVTAVRFYLDEAGHVPVLAWLTDLRKSDRKAYAKCLARIHRLATLGHELRRPEADYLRDGIYELRARKGRVNYRMLYFFQGRNVAVLVTAITKQDEVPAVEIERAIERKRLYEESPEQHAYEEDIRDA